MTALLKEILMLRKCLFLILSVTFCFNLAVASDWTEFRGPTGQGHSDAVDLPTTWSEDENIAWKVDLPGNGWSSPVVAGGRIYVTAAVPVDDKTPLQHSLRVLCLSATDGKTIWDVEVFQHSADEKIEVHNKNSHASPTPILEGDRLYVHFGPHGTACLKTDSTIIWKNTDLLYAPQHGNGGSPAIAGDVMVICCDGKDQRFVTGLDMHLDFFVCGMLKDFNVPDCFAVGCRQAQNSQRVLQRRLIVNGNRRRYINSATCDHRR